MSSGGDVDQKAEFDTFAASYEALHAVNVAAGGEPPEYYAIYKQRVLERLLGEGYDRPILDFGCGIGSLTRVLGRSFATVDGYDPSAESLRMARERAPEARFFERTEALPTGHYGAVVLANVLHHVEPSGRPALARLITNLLAPGGRLVIFEHNPLNPVTRQVVAACEFDVNAVLLYPWQVKRLLRDAGLGDVRLQYIVFFPKALAAARPLERRLGWLPLGAQVCSWGTKE